MSLRDLFYNAIQGKNAYINQNDNIPEGLFYIKKTNNVPIFIEPTINDLETNLFRMKKMNEEKQKQKGAKIGSEEFSVDTFLEKHGYKKYE